MFAGTFPPVGWATCDGQLLSISQNTALFSILGTSFGGNGQSTFALPDLRGRVPVHAGQGPGLSSYSVGQEGGEEAHTLATPEVPVHSHAVGASAADGTVTHPAGAVPARGGSYSATPDGTTMNPAMIGNVGGGAPHNNVQPYQAVTFIIALQGVFPSRS